MTQPGPKRRGRLLVIDLECSAPMRSLIGALARLHSWRRVAQVWMSGRPDPGLADTVMVSAQQGSAPTLRLPESTLVRWRADFVSDETMSEIALWTVEVVTNLLSGAHRIPFPELYGVSLGQLARLPLELSLWNDVQLVAAVRTAGGSGEFAGCDILTAGEHAGPALLAEASLLFPQARLITRRGFSLLHSTRRLANRLRRTGAKPRVATETGARDPVSLPPHTGVVIVAESRPMSYMFASVERALSELTGHRALRLQFGNPDAHTGAQTPGDVVHLPSQFNRVDDTFQSAFGAEYRVPVGAATLTHAKQTIAGKACLAPLQGFIPAFGDRMLPAIATHLARAKRLLDQLSPSLLVVGNDRWYVGQAFVLLARQRGIPTLCVQDGISGDIPAWSWISADHFATSGTSLFRHLLAHGVSSSRLTITGQPRYDRFITLTTRAARSQARQSLGRSSGQPVVTFATQYGQDANFVRSVIQGILMVPNVHLLVRPHPSDDSVAIREIVRAFPAERCEVWGSDPVEDLLLGSDVLVTQSSTVGVEAALLGVPVMTVHFSGGESIVPYARLGISLEARSAEEIAEILKRLLDGPSRRAYAERSHAALEYLMGPLDGKASRRVAQLIARMMSASSSVPT